MSESLEKEKDVNPGLFVAVRLATLEQMRASTIIDAVGKIVNLAAKH